MKATPQPHHDIIQPGDVSELGDESDPERCAVRPRMDLSQQSINIDIPLYCKPLPGVVTHVIVIMLPAAWLREGEAFLIPFRRCSYLPYQIRGLILEDQYYRSPVCIYIRCVRLIV